VLEGEEVAVRDGFGDRADAVVEFVVDHVVAALDVRGDRLCATTEGDEGAVRIGVDGASADLEPCVGKGLEALGVTVVGAVSLGDLGGDLAGHVEVEEHVLLIEDASVLGIDHVPVLLVVVGVDVGATGGDEGHAEDRFGFP
jgi:hypothetical protein